MNIKKISGEVVGKIFFGSNLNNFTFEEKPLTLSLANLMSDFAVLAGSPLRFILGDWLADNRPAERKLMNRIEQFRSICMEIVQKQKLKFLCKDHSRSNMKDMLEVLLEHQASGVEGAMTDEEIVDEFITFFLAGMDTTAHLVTMMTYHLHENPDCQEQVRNEVKEYYEGRTPNEITIDSINSMKFLNLVVNETLRIDCPVLGIARIAAQDHTIGHFKIKKGTLVGMSQTSLNFNPKNHEEPFKFNPSRWLKSPSKNVGPFGFLPFSAGPRNCIGQHLAQIEAKIIISEMLSKFQFKVSEGYAHKMTVRLLYEPLQDLIVDLTKK